MSNECVPVSELPMMLRTQTYWAEQMVKSRLFKDVTSTAQALVKIQAGREMGLDVFASMKSLYIIPGSGKVSPDANLIAGKVRSSKKYDYKILKHTDDLCEIEFFYKNPDGTRGESLGKEKFDKADAKRAGTKNMDKFPRNMLFARCIMNGVRFYCPDLMGNSSTLPYSIEEIADNFSFESDGSVKILEAEVVNVNEDLEGQKVLKSLLEEKCKGVGLTLSQLADSLELSESVFDSMDESAFEQFSKLVEERKKN